MAALLVLGILALVASAAAWLFIALAAGMSDNPEYRPSFAVSWAIAAVGAVLIVLWWALR